jgi:RHS repeat-associated protein
MVSGAVQEYYAYEGLDRVAIVGPNVGSSPGAIVESYLFDGIDHPLRIARPGVASTNYYYYEIDLAGNVRGLRASGGADLGGYRYSAFGKTLEDTSMITQPLRWKARWFSPVAGGTYDVRARQWSPELGVFLSIDGFDYHSKRWTLWSWPAQSPIRFGDVSGHNLSSFLGCVLGGGGIGSCWTDEKRLLQQGCNESPNACKLMGGVPGRGGPFSNDEPAIRDACRQGAEIDYLECIKANGGRSAPRCEQLRVSSEAECLKKAGLELLECTSFGFPFLPAGGIPALP